MARVEFCSAIELIVCLVETVGVHVVAHRRLRYGIREDIVHLLVLPLAD